MAEITLTDAKILLVVSLAIVSMSLVFPPLGLTDESSVNESEIPTFNVTADRFSFAGSAPAPPGTPSSGRLWLNTSAVQFSENVIWLEGGTSGGYEMALFDNGNESQVRINEWNSSGFIGYSVVNLSKGESATVSRDGYEVAVETTDDMNASAGYYEVDWRLKEQPSAGGAFIGRIPIVGGIVDAGAQIAGVVAWIGAVIYWIGQSFLEIILNGGGAVFDVTSYLFGLVSFVATTYTAIVTASQAWAAVFVALPGIIFSVLFAKFVAVALGMLPG